MLRRLLSWLVALPIVAVAISRSALADDKPKADKAAPTLVHELKDNVRMRLVGVRFSQARAHNLIVKFETLDKAPAARVLHFPPGSLTVNEETLRTVVMSCVDLDGRADAEGWFAPHTKAIFSVPKEDPRDRGEYHPFEKCFLVSLKLKKE